MPERERERSCSRPKPQAKQRERERKDPTRGNNKKARPATGTWGQDLPRCLVGPGREKGGKHYGHDREADNCVLKGSSLRGGAARKQLQQAAESSTRTDQTILTRFRTKATAVKTKAKKPNTAGPNSTQRTRGTGHPASTSSISGTTTGTSRPTTSTTRTTSTTTRRTRTPTGTRSREPQKPKPKSRPQQRRNTKPRSTDSTPRRAERPRSSTSSSSSSTSPSTRPRSTTLNGTGHTATEADVRWACEKRTEGPRDGCSDQRHPQLGTSTTATTTTTTAT